MSERPTAAAHRVVKEAVKPGEMVVDATAGNGHDTLFLAEWVGPTGKVVAFDIQQAAIESTRRRLDKAGVVDRVDLHGESHTHMAQRVERGGVAAVMFNLGYLPGADHALITQTEETLLALETAVALLRSGGVVTVVCYPGHEGGDREAAAVVEWADARGGVVYPQAREGAPFLVVLRAD
ncbi:MAG: class I SAM-dependent methyltransferase [Haloferula sp.]